MLPSTATVVENKNSKGFKRRCKRVDRRGKKARDQNRALEL